MTRITAAAGGHTVMDFSYGYGASSQNTGRVRSRTDAVQSEHSATYTYDSIYRLRQVQGAGQSWGVSWTFDTWGNRLTQTPSGLATSKVGTQTLGYTSTTTTATRRSCTMRPATRRPMARTTTPSTPQTRSLKWTPGRCLYL